MHGGSCQPLSLKFATCGEQIQPSHVGCRLLCSIGASNHVLLELPQRLVRQQRVQSLELP